MKVAGVKGIRLIMGAAKDERGSVFCNTKQWDVLWLPWRADLYKRPLSGWVCSGASNTVLYRSYGRDHLWGCEASKSVTRPVGRCSSICLSWNLWDLDELWRGPCPVFHRGVREIRRVSVLLSSICIRHGFGLRETIENRFTCINWQFWSFVGSIYFLQRCAFSAQSGLYTDLWAGRGKAALMSEAAESCLPSPLFWHELLSVIFALYIAEKCFLVT